MGVACVPLTRRKPFEEIANAVHHMHISISVDGFRMPDQRFDNPPGTSSAPPRVFTCRFDTGGARRIEIRRTVPSLVRERQLS